MQMRWTIATCNIKVMASPMVKVSLTTTVSRLKKKKRSRMDNNRSSSHKKKLELRLRLQQPYLLQFQRNSRRRAINVQKIKDVKGRMFELLRLRRARSHAAEADETVRLAPEPVEHIADSAAVEPGCEAAQAPVPAPELVERAGRQRDALTAVRATLEELRSELQDFRSQA